MILLRQADQKSRRSNTDLAREADEAPGQLVWGSRGDHEHRVIQQPDQLFESVGAGHYLIVCHLFLRAAAKPTHPGVFDAAVRGNPPGYNQVKGATMATSTIVWIVVAAIAAILVIAAVMWMAQNQRNRRRHGEAESIRDQAKEETVRVQRREALAQETSAKARAAQAEAEAKGAEAARLQERAAAHQGEVTTSRGKLNEQFERADTLDPATKTPETTETVADADGRDGGSRGDERLRDERQHSDQRSDSADTVDRGTGAAPDGTRPGAEPQHR